MPSRSLKGMLLGLVGGRGNIGTIVVNHLEQELHSKAVIAEIDITISSGIF